MDPLKRIRFFNGRLLSASDFSDEQEYQLRKQRRVNLGALGAGIVSGLHVSAEANGIRVAPGFAIDSLGREIFLTDAELVLWRSDLLRAQLVISYKETLTDPMPSPSWGEVEYGGIEEGCLLEFVPAGSAGSESLVLAELEHTLHGWRMIHPPRSGKIWMVAAAFAAGLLLSCCRRTG